MQYTEIEKKNLEVAKQYMAIAYSPKENKGNISYEIIMLVLY
jgi:hypothetical protein